MQDIDLEELVDALEDIVSNFKQEVIPFAKELS